MDLSSIERIKRLRMTDESRMEEYQHRLYRVEEALDDLMGVIDDMIEAIERDFPFEEVEEDDEEQLANMTR